MGNAYLALEAQNRANRKATEESRREASKNGAPPTTEQDVEYARREYVSALDRFQRLLDPNSEEALRNRGPHLVPVQQHQEMIVRALKLRLDEVRERYEAQERKKAREEDANAAAESHELATKQTELAEIQADAAKAQVAIARGASRAAWFAGVAAAAAIVMPLVQSCHR